MNFKRTDYSGDDERQLHCPICDFEYTHLENVVTEKDKEGRLATTLYFSCESGHKFSYYIHNHKGYTMVNHIEKAYS